VIALLIGIVVGSSLLVVEKRDHIGSRDMGTSPRKGQQPLSMGDNMQTKNYCNACGAALRENAAFCINCGNKISGSKAFLWPMLSRASVVLASSLISDTTCSH